MHEDRFLRWPTQQLSASFSLVTRRVVSCCVAFGFGSSAGLALRVLKSGAADTTRWVVAPEATSATSVALLVAVSAANVHVVATQDRIATGTDYCDTLAQVRGSGLISRAATAFAHAAGAPALSRQCS